MICSHTTCWYCDEEMKGRHEHDHVRPRRHGGTITVPACLDCHNLKDRIPVLKWPAAAALHALTALAADRLFAAASDAIRAVEMGHRAPRLRWQEPKVVQLIGNAPPGLPRVLLAKMYALGMDAAALDAARAAAVRSRCRAL